MPQAGQLLQVDGSRHRWLGIDGPFLTLVGAIDDATGVVTAGTFREHEDAAGYFAILAATVRSHGLPMAIYSDRHTLFVVDRTRRPTLAEQLERRAPRTQVGRALEQAGIGWIGARSPQAKGRIERLWGTLQDRLVGELRLGGREVHGRCRAPSWRDTCRVTTPASGWRPSDPVAAWRDWGAGRPRGGGVALPPSRRVANDATVSWAGRHSPLAAARRGSWPGRSVVIEERLDGSLGLAMTAPSFRLSRGTRWPGALRSRGKPAPAAGTDDTPTRTAVGPARG